MDNISRSLFQGEMIHLTPFDPERDAEIEAEWSNDADFLALIDIEPIRPLTAPLIKKRYAEEEKDKQSFVAAIRRRAEDRLVGRATLKHIDGTNGSALVAVAIGNLSDRGRGYGTEALRLVLGYAFDELNLFRVGADVFEYNAGALRWLERRGFSIEVRRREAIHRAGRRWDILSVGLLREEWMQKTKRDRASI